MKIRLPLLVVLLLPVLPCAADEVVTGDGRRLVGRILKNEDGQITILTYKDGPIVVPASDVRGTKPGPTLYDDYDKKIGDFEDTSEGHFKLGQWCQGKGLTWQARIEWRKALEKDSEHEGARAALGDKKTKDGWITFEEQQTAKGFIFFEGRWLKKADIDRIVAARHPSVGLDLTATYFEDTDKAFLESWAERVKMASQFMWELTDGQMYVKQITVTDKGGPADFTIVNKDSMKIRPGVYAEAGADTISAPGQILAYTFFHELIHFKFARPDHCINCRHCIMSSDPTANQLCDDGDHKEPPKTSCWGAIRAKHKDLTLKPLARKAKPGSVPPTAVVIKDR